MSFGWVDVIDLGPFNPDAVIPEGHNWHAIFSRRVIVEPPAGFKCSSSGKSWGEEIVAYRCDETGEVTNWEERLELRAHNYQTAVRKLRFLLRNDLTVYYPAPTED